MAGAQTTAIGIDDVDDDAIFTCIRVRVGDDEYRNRCDKDGTRRPRTRDTWQMTAVNSDGGEYKLNKKKIMPAARTYTYNNIIRVSRHRNEKNEPV